jgi:hypothetical protein
MLLELEKKGTCALIILVGQSCRGGYSYHFIHYMHRIKSTIDSYNRAGIVSTLQRLSFTSIFKTQPLLGRFSLFFLYRFALYVSKIVRQESCLFSPFL